jgi:hypothetical protein
MIRRADVVMKLIPLAALACNLASAQQPSTTTLIIDLGNAVEYQGDIYDVGKFARNPNTTPSAGLTSSGAVANFAVATLIGDIVAVNGQPAKGLYAGRSRVINASPTPVSTQAIADVTRISIREHVFEILQPDGTPIGTIMAMGLTGGNPPPGQPSTERANWAIVGGTGAFLGARGQVEGGPAGCGGRAASMAEDPANRRINGGGVGQCVLHIIPVTVPQIVTTANGPAITHSSDFSLVNASKPAATGEILALFAMGLGPVRGVVTGDPFPSNPSASVNSPVQVLVNGNPAEVIGAVGYPGSVDGYQVNFRVPSDIPKGTVSIQVTAAWISSSPVSIAVQ